MSSEYVKSYRDLVVWQRAMQMVTKLYELTAQFPKEEMYGLTSQMRRSAVSIPSNISEGRYRGTKKDYLQFLRNAFASGAELETQLEIAKRLQGTRNLNYKLVDSLLDEVMKMLNVMIRTLNPSKNNPSEAREASAAIS